jgi:hypothetical protein
MKFMMCFYQDGWKNFNLLSYNLYDAKCMINYLLLMSICLQETFHLPVMLIPIVIEMFQHLKSSLLKKIPKSKIHEHFEKIMLMNK